VPFTPGTGIDILARTLGQKMGDDFKQAVIVDNRPGRKRQHRDGGRREGRAGRLHVADDRQHDRAESSLFKSIPYDPIKDFVPIAPLAIGRLALVTHPSIGVKTVADFVALAKREPGKLNYGSPGNGTPHHLAMELFKSKTGIDIVHVPYKGTSGAVTDLLSGQINVMFLPVHVALPYVESGKLDMLAAGGIARASATPAIPSLAEAAGIREVDTDIWYGLYAPAGTPADVVLKLGAEINALLKSRDVADTLAKQGLQPTGGTSDDLAQLTRSDLERWSVVVRDAKIQPD
jgi:tripartite-type tricarboxylate transporter receptor subunit TctC